MLIEYESQIYIIRAITLFLVILNHLEFSNLSVGFIGVDIFVISGYPITKKYK